MSAKYKKGDLVFFNIPMAFGGAHFKSRNHHYQNPGIILSVEKRHTGTYAYRVWWGGVETSEHECYLGSKEMK